MRRILIVSPVFPPADLPDMHRIRMNVGHYPKFGWEPVVLAVEPSKTGFLIDPDLSLTLPEGLETHWSGAFPQSLARLAGIGAVGLRAHRALGRVGADLIRARKLDLAFFSTTVFPVMTLGAHWKRRFGVPYVLDIQDPWSTLPAKALPPPRTGLKSMVMQRLHRRLERIAMESTGGLIAVSPDYIEALQAAYPPLRHIPVEVIPFGHEARDLEIARQRGRAVSFTFARGPGPICLFAGRAAPDMIPVFRALFAVQAAGVRLHLPHIEQLRLAFVGTGYARDNPHVIEPLARQAGVADRISEHPNRVSLLDAKRTGEEAEILLVAGSNDLAYQPSKFYQSLATNRPILCVGHDEGPVARLADGEESIFLVTAEADPASTAVALDVWLQGVAEGRMVPSQRRRETTAQYSAEALARRECALFDRVVEMGREDSRRGRG